MLGGSSDEFDPSKNSILQNDGLWQGKKYTFILTKLSVRICRIGACDKSLHTIYLSDIYSVNIPDPPPSSDTSDLTPPESAPPDIPPPSESSDPNTQTPSESSSNQLQKKETSRNHSLTLSLAKSLSHRGSKITSPPEYDIIIYSCMKGALIGTSSSSSSGTGQKDPSSSGGGASVNNNPLVKKEFHISFEGKEIASKWKYTMDELLWGPEEQRRKQKLLILVNPFSGSGRSLHIFQTVKDIFDRAENIQYTFQETQKARHALEICRDLDVDDFDGVVCCSGDGLLWEAVNGLCSRKDWRRAVSLKLGIIPAGSGNGLAHSLGLHCPLRASMSIVKETSRPLDLWTVDQSGKKCYGFLSLSWCLIGDIDIESENLRWMGDTRFTVGAVKRVVVLRKYSGRISYLPADNTPQNQKGCGYYCNCKYFDPNHVEYEDDSERGGIKMHYSADDRSLEDEWETYEGQLTYFMAANTCLMANQTYSSPYAHCSDGCIDLLFLKDSGRISAMSVLLDLENGNFIKHKFMEFKKVKAFRIEPTGEHKGIFSLDGERMEEAAILCEVHRGIIQVFCSRT